MIISKTPYRISFFGGGSDYPSWYLKNGGEVISSTIDKYIYISCRTLPPFFQHKYRIVWSKVESVKNVNQIQLKPVREMIKKFKIKDGLEIHYDGDLPARSGMGSSSVFVVGLLNIFNHINKNKLKNEILAKQSIQFEQKVLKEVVGSQDQIAASCGGFNKIIFNKGGSFLVKPISIKNETIKNLNQNLILVYTGLTRNAHDIASSYVNKLKSTKRSQILEILNFVKEAENILKKGDLSSFGKLLHESWIKKKELSNFISNNKIDDIYKYAISKGALGGKLLGAGGGGFFLFYVPKHYQKSFINSFKKLLHIPFNFSQEGSKIIFNNKD
ncbi:MAG: D-glycero-alpha-D-manno-heptose-7-phosphate kinase [Pelagibacterales bacterium]|nr:D-glycero-alpha-D-manno-heptose-7-phosphate kinase [Pelagibacterales bacterium]